MNKTFWRIAALSAFAVNLSLIFGSNAQAAEWKPGIPRTAYATLFEWSWESVAKECKNFLGPKGYAAVQVSPPQEHIAGSAWWTRYQPLSYQLQSRGGVREQFKQMIDTCKAAGVDVYVDAVINHMAAAGTEFPKVPYTASDFHPNCAIQESDYIASGNRDRVTQCRLDGLPDLDTANPAVQTKIAAYLNDLISLGVAGFRIDAAKHIRPSELSAIKAKVPGAYFFNQEVTRDGSVAADLPAYAALGSVNEFFYVYTLKNAFLNRDGASLSTLAAQIGSNGWLPAEKASVFIHNHDTERRQCSAYQLGAVCDSLNVFSGEKLYLAHIFMLAHSYGYPSVASGYYFNTADMTPSSQPYAATETAPANCSSVIQTGKWDCIHRDRRVANMVGFRNYTHGAALANWVTGNNQQIAFSRGSSGFVALNNADVAWQQTFTTGLADGIYCNVVAVDQPESSCPAEAQVIVSGGKATLSIPPGGAVAIHRGAKTGVGPEPMPLTRPTELKLSGILEDSTKLDWKPSVDNIGIAGYQVFRNGTLIATVTGITFTDSGLEAGTNYAYTVRAFDPAGNQSPMSEAVLGKTLPLAADTASVYYANSSWTAANLHYGINNSWTPSPGAPMTRATCAGYWKKNVKLGSAANMAATFNNGSRWDNNGGRNYTLNAGISAVANGLITSGASPCAAADKVAPTAPTQLTKTSQQNGKLPATANIGLSWTAASDNVQVIAYAVYRNDVRIGVAVGTRYTDSDVPVGTVYSYTVRALDAADNLSLPSAPLTVTLSDPMACEVPPQKPDPLVVVETARYGVGLRWQATQSCDPATGRWGRTPGYAVYRNGVKIATVAGNTFADNGLLPDTEYSYAVGSGDPSFNSAVVKARTLTTNCAEIVAAVVLPHTLYASDITANSASLSWPPILMCDPSSGTIKPAASYELYRNSSLIVKPEQTSYTSRDMQPSTNYTFDVVGLNAAGQRSRYRGQVNFTTREKDTGCDPIQPDVILPHPVTVADLSSTGVSLSWPPLSMCDPATRTMKPVTYYEVRRDGQAVGRPVDPSFADKGLTPATKYVYDIAGIGTGGSASIYRGRVEITTKPRQCVLPAPPAPISIEERTATTITLRWGPAFFCDPVLDVVKEAVAYEIYRNDVKIGTTTETRFIDTNVSAGTSNTYRVLALDAHGNRYTPYMPFGPITSASNPITVYYKQGFATTCFHYAPQGGSWSTLPGLKMTASEIAGYNKITVEAGAASSIQVAFNNCNGQWDNNGGSNYQFGSGTWTYDAGRSTRVVAGAPSVQALIKVSFNLTASVSAGQKLYLVGNVSALGSWNPDNALALSQNGNLWWTSVPLVANQTVEYKYVKKDANNTIVWESGSNRSFAVNAESSTRSDVWK